MKIRSLLLVCIAGSLASQINAQVTFDRLLNSAKEPQNWMSYSGGFQSQRHSALTPDHSGQREESGTAVGLPAAFARKI